jgi:hypothetical protein
MAGAIIYTVFVSSTYDDLREERAAVQKALLQLHCMPIGMELFGSADEETWDFIKRQIEDCDYYVVVVADKYGSTADDGVSYTEKEYDYAREIKKPVLAFLHKNRESIPRNKTEQDPEKRSKLEAFVQKISRSPVSFFTVPHDLATQVTVSFANQRDRRDPRQPGGFIRADQVADLNKDAANLQEKYLILQEENARLRAELEELNTAEGAGGPFPHAFESNAFTLWTVEKQHSDGSERDLREVEVSIIWKDLFVNLAERIFANRNNNYIEAISDVINLCIFASCQEGGPISRQGYELDRIALRLVSWGLVNRLRNGDLELTPYGKKQYGLLSDLIF